MSGRIFMLLAAFAIAIPAAGTAAPTCAGEAGVCAGTAALRDAARMAQAASPRSDADTCGPYPWSTATGAPFVPGATGSRPTARREAPTPAPPTASTSLPGGYRSARTRAAASELVSTSPSVSGTPRAAKWSATCAGVREALLVAKTTGTSRAPSASTACGTADAPATTTPSMSQMIAS